MTAFTEGAQLVSIGDGDVQVRTGGEYHGVVWEGISREGLCLLNLEHYSAAGLTGRFAPRNTRISSSLPRPDEAQLNFGATSTWRLRSSIRYRALGSDVVDATFSFIFARPYAAFEAFIASYFPAGTPSPWVVCTGGWRRFQPADQEQVFIPHDDASARRAADGRWRVLVEAGYKYRVTTSRYAKALMMTRPAGDDRIVLQLVAPAECSQLSPNTFASAHDLSVVGKDVAAGEIVNVRTRLVCRRGLGRAEALEIYEAFVEERHAQPA